MRRFISATSATSATAIFTSEGSSIWTIRMKWRRPNASTRVSSRAIAAEDTCTGEHGVGTGKIKFMEMEHSSTLKVMRAIKQALDPRDLFNPGRILPPQAS